MQNILQKIGNNFLQNIFHNKIYKYFLQKKIPNKIVRKYEFFSSDSDQFRYQFTKLKIISY